MVQAKPSSGFPSLLGGFGPLFSSEAAPQGVRKWLCGTGGYKRFPRGSHRVRFPYTRVSKQVEIDSTMGD